MLRIISLLIFGRRGQRWIVASLCHGTEPDINVKKEAKQSSWSENCSSQCCQDFGSGWQQLDSVPGRKGKYYCQDFSVEIDKSAMKPRILNLLGENDVPWHQPLYVRLKCIANQWKVELVQKEGHGVANKFQPIWRMSLSCCENLQFSRKLLLRQTNKPLQGIFFRSSEIKIEKMTLTLIWSIVNTMVSMRQPSLFAGGEKGWHWHCTVRLILRRCSSVRRWRSTPPTVACCLILEIGNKELLNSPLRFILLLKPSPSSSSTSSSTHSGACSPLIALRLVSNSNWSSFAVRASSSFRNSWNINFFKKT